MDRSLNGPAVSIVLMLVIGACSGPLAPRPSPSSSSPVPSPAPTVAVVSATPATSESAASEPATSVPTGPPVAAIAAEGGDLTDGQLGTYLWGDAGSDSPWLPGARIAVGSGEPLTVRFTPTVAVASWRARSVPAGADGPAGARILGEGLGGPRFEAPPAGTWTVEVHVVFANDAGIASYFWQLAVD